MSTNADSQPSQIPSDLPPFRRGNKTRPPCFSFDRVVREHWDRKDADRILGYSRAGIVEDEDEPVG